MSATIYPQPPEMPRSALFRVFIDDIEAPVLHTPAAALCCFAIDGAVDVRVEIAGPAPHHAVVRPLSRGIPFDLDDSTLNLSLDHPEKLVIELDEKSQTSLFLLADPISAVEPPPESGDWIRFEPGKFHEGGVIEVARGQSVFIPGGAVVRARLIAQHCENIEIRGPGILLGDWQPPRGVSGVCEGTSRPTFQLAGCREITVRDLLILNSGAWTTVTVDCERIRYENHKVVTWNICDDGMDIVGSRDVTVSNAFVFSRDDCVAIKACAYLPFLAMSGQKDVRNILIEGSTFLNAECGNALEVGFETQCDTIENITFRDCDILRVLPEGNISGAALAIHSGNHARIRHVTFDDIRIEQAMDKFMDFVVFSSPYDDDPRLGGIEDVVVKNIRFLGGLLPRSFIHGLDATHAVHDVRIENITMDGAAFRSGLNSNHGIPTTTAPHPPLRLKEAIRETLHVWHAKDVVIV